MKDSREQPKLIDTINLNPKCIMSPIYIGKSDIYHALQAMLIPYRSVDLSIACAVKESERK